jgi:hypothetical protein
MSLPTVAKRRKRRDWRRERAASLGTPRAIRALGHLIQAALKTRTKTQVRLAARAIGVVSGTSEHLVLARYAYATLRRGAAAHLDWEAAGVLERDIHALSEGELADLLLEDD